MKIIKLIKEMLKPCVWNVRKLRDAEFSYRELYDSTFMFSQFGEDLVVQSLLDGLDNGFYVDVGAYRPIRLSNTYRFYRKGWSGINVEPCPKFHQELNEVRPRDINLNIGVAGIAGECDFLVDDVFSGMKSSNYAHDRHSDSSHIIKIQTKPLRLILEEHVPSGKEIDFLSVDCEGHDMEVLQSNDWTAYRPKVVLVEDLKKGEDSSIYHFMQANEYSFLVMMGYTAIFVENEFMSKTMPYSKFKR